MILVDTGPIVALTNARDDRHAECRSLLERLSGPLLVPATVATEVCMLLERRCGTTAELAFLADVRAAVKSAAVDQAVTAAQEATRARWPALFLDGLTADAPSTTD